MGPEAVAERFERLTDLEMIVDFAIEDDGGIAIIGNDGLIAGREVNNLEAGCAQRAVRRAKDSTLVGSAMMQGAGGLADALRPGIPRFGRITDYAAHVISTPENCLPSSADS